MERLRRAHVWDSTEFQPEGTPAPSNMLLGFRSYKPYTYFCKVLSIRLKAIALRLEAISSRLEVMAFRFAGAKTTYGQSASQVHDSSMQHTPPSAMDKAPTCRQFKCVSKELLATSMQDSSQRAGRNFLEEALATMIWLQELQRN